MKMAKFGRIMKYVAAFLIPMVFTMLVMNEMDNDSWFVLAEGRYISENGVYFTDVLSIHEGLEITVQQYGFAVIFWQVYAMLGPVGLYMMMLGLNFVITVLLYKICMLLSNKNANLSLFITVITDLLLTLGFVTMRAQMASYCIFLAVIYVLELYIRSGKMKYLWWIPVLSLIQINLHASVWLMIFLIMAAYFVDGIKKPKLHLQGYRKKPLVIVGLVAFVAGFLNPYGWKMITFIFTSYGASEIIQMVDEMKPFNLRTIFNVLLYIGIAGSMIFYLFGDKRRVRVRYVLMYLGFLALGLNTVKGMSQFILVMFLPLALMYKNTKIEKIIEDAKARRAMMIWSGATVVCMGVTLLVMMPDWLDTRPYGNLKEAVDTMEASVEESGKDKKDLKVYAGYNWGGYLEFRGYKAYLDPRAEVFLKKRNGEKDTILREWNKLHEAAADWSEFLDKYDFDYLLVDKFDDGMRRLKRADYEVIYGDDDLEFIILKHIRE